MSDSLIAKTPVTEQQVDEALAAFTLVMRAKMVKNLHKGHWLDPAIHGTYLFKRLHDEVEELKAALDAVRGFHDPSYPSQADDIVKECADVANFAMMIADSVRICPDCSMSRFSYGHRVECHAAAPSEAIP